MVPAFKNVNYKVLIRLSKAICTRLKKQKRTRLTLF